MLPRDTSGLTRCSACSSRELRPSQAGGQWQQAKASSMERLLTLRMYSMSCFFRTKEAAMTSMSLGTPHLTRSSSSFLVRVGRSTTTPGRLTFLRSLQACSLAHLMKCGLAAISFHMSLLWLVREAYTAHEDACSVAAWQVMTVSGTTSNCTSLCQAV